MARHQKYGIKYPFTSDNNENMYLDVNETEMDCVKSKVLHVIFTPKGQKIRDPEFGTDLIKYIFNENDDYTMSEIKGEISESLKKYVPEIEFKNFNVYKDENDGHSIIVTIEYGIKVGNKMEITTVGVKI